MSLNSKIDRFEVGDIVRDDSWYKNSPVPSTDAYAVVTGFFDETRTGVYVKWICNQWGDPEEDYPSNLFVLHSKATPLYKLVFNIT